MAIRIKTISATDLRLASAITKRNFATAISLGGTSGKVAGFWQACFVRLPASGFTNSTVYPLWGADLSGTGGFGGGNDTAISLGGDSAAQGALRLKPRVSSRSNGNPAFSSTPRDFTSLSALTATGSDVYLLIFGVQNTGTDAAPVWQGWCARVLVGGGVSSEVDATALNAAYISNASGTLLAQLFNSRPATGPARSPVNLAMENFAHVNGDFPWDTANNRPHHDALLALAAGSGAPGNLHNYASLIAAQNAGTLGYANLRGSARADLSFWWTLSNLGAGLANSGSGAATALVPTNWNSLTDGLEDVASFTPAHWTPNPTITAPAILFHGGRGARAFTASGTYQAGTTALERRWVVSGTSTAVPGFDWAPVTLFGGAGTWSTTDTLPPGRHDLQVRDSNNVSRSAVLTGLMVGTVLLVHAQSGSQFSFASNGNVTLDVNGQNMTGVAVAAGAAGMVLRLANAYGGVPATYAQPAPIATPLIGGEVPAVGQGTITCLNEWHANNPGHPLLIVNMALEGSIMANWAANASLTVHRSPSTIGHASWFYMGTIGAVAGPSSGNNSGIAETLAALIGRWVDVHYMMWTPGMASDEATRTAYVAAINARFSANTDGWWLVVPPWRGHRSPSDTSAMLSKRAEHVAFVAERGARGVLGPYWPDTVMDGNPQPADSAGAGSLHPAFHSTASAGTVGSPVSDQNQVGASRIGRGVGRALAWVFDRSIKAHGPRVVAAWFRDGARTVIEVELGRAVRTLNGAAISNQFWISTDGGTTFARTGFTVALDASGTRAVLTSTGAAWPASNVRVDYARAWPFAPIDGDIDETLTERKLDGLLYDDQTYRGGVNLAAPAGNPLASANGSGVAVAVRGSAKLLATERWTGTRNVTVRMLAADGVTVLREKTLAITAS